jgi:hypothetical protein
VDTDKKDGPRVERIRFGRLVKLILEAMPARAVPNQSNPLRSKQSMPEALDELLPLLVDDDARRWVAYIPGTQDQQACIGQIEQLRQRDPEVYFAVTVLWKILASWVHDLEEF